MSDVETASVPSAENATPVTADPAPQVDSGTPAPSGEEKDGNGYSIPPSATPGSTDPLGDALGEVYDRVTGESKAASPEKAEAPPPAEDTASQDEVKAAPETEADEPAEQGHAQPVIDAPQSWSAEAKDEWASLTPKAQEYVAKREAEAHRQISQQGEIVSAFEPVIRELQQTAYANQPPAEMLTTLVRAQTRLDANPAEGIKWIAESYGVDLSSLVDRPAEDGGLDDLFHDPRVDTLKNELAEIKQHNQALQQQQQEYWQQQRQQAYEHKASEVQTAIEQAGKTHEHFEALRDQIALEIKGLQVINPELGPKEMLDKAYERAFALSPDVQQKARASAEAKAKKEAEAKLAKAKAQQTANTKSSERVSRSNDASWDDHDTMREMFDTIQGR